MMAMTTSNSIRVNPRRSREMVGPDFIKELLTRTGREVRGVGGRVMSIPRGGRKGIGLRCSNIRWEDRRRWPLEATRKLRGDGEAEERWACRVKRVPFQRRF